MVDVQKNPLDETQDREEQKNKKTEEAKNEESKEQKSKEQTEETNKEKEEREGEEEEKRKEEESVKPEETKPLESGDKAKAGPEKEEKKPAPSGKFKDLIKQIENLSVLELAELVKALEERFGVSAAAPVVVAASGAAPSTGANVEAAEEKANYTIHLADAGAQKIAVIKAIREIRQDLGLKEAKDLVDAAPKDVKADVPKAEAEEAKKKLEAVGAKVELK